MRILVSLAASLLLTGCPPSPTPTPAEPTPAEPTPAEPTPAEPTPVTTPAASPDQARLPDASPETSEASANTSGTVHSNVRAVVEPSALNPGAALESGDATTHLGEPANPSPEIVPDFAEPAPDASAQPPEMPVSYEGHWTVADSQGQAFDIIIFPNGQAVSTWTKGTGGARGERGYWRQDQRGLTVAYSDGSTDVIEREKHQFQHRRYSAGSPLDSQPLARGEARRGEGNGSALVGIWRLNKEPDGSHLYIALQSGGRAVSTINGGTEGKWRVNEKGALCEWPDGWVDQIEQGSAGWQKRSWVGSESVSPADLSQATRVGEARFSVEP